MKFPNIQKRNHIGKILLAYAGGAWVIIQVIYLIISQYEFSVAFLDVFIILFLFGIPSAILYAFYGNNFTKRLKLIYGINIILALSIISYYFIKPDSIHPNQIKFLKFKDNQKQLAKSIQSIAILPFSNFTGDPKKEYLSYAIHDALIIEMGSISSLRVISKTTSQMFKNQNISLQDIANELKVDAIMEGSLLSVGDRIKVNVSLINAFPQEIQLWSKDYSVSMSNLLNVYSKITQNLAEEIDLPLTQQEQFKLAKKKSVDPEAYKAYLKGIYSMGFLTQDRIKAAMSYFEKAIELDPNFAPSYAALGGVWGFLKQMNIVSTDEANIHFGPNIEKAKKLDSTLAEVYYWQAIKHVWTDYNWVEGEKAFKKAIELKPNSSETRGLYSNFLMAMMRLKEARTEMDKALELDPKNPFILTLNSVQYTFEEDYENSIALAESLQKIMPTNPLVNLVLFISYAESQNYDLCIAQAKIWLELEDHSELVPLIEQEYQDNGFQSAFLTTATALEKKDNAKLVAQTMQSFYALSGNVDKTLDWMEKGFIRKDPDVPVFKGVPILKPYRNHPRFKELITRLNLK